MKKKYYIIDSLVAPAFFEAVLQAKEQIETFNSSVSEECNKHNISRSTYYKYKDKIARFEKNEDNAILAFSTFDKKGILSDILSTISKSGASVITINQNVPVNDNAYIIINMNTSELHISLKELISSLENIEYVKSVSVMK